MASDGPDRESVISGGADSSTNAGDGSEIFDGRYALISVLGKGGMGTVLKARHKSLSKIVAIKVLNASTLTDETSRTRFELEAQAGSKLSHPHLVAVFDHGVTRHGEPYLVMEYIVGDSLEDLIRKGKLDTSELLQYFTQVCKALQYIHNNNIIHRDLKPSNIMIQVIGDERYAKLLDFGIAKVLDDQGYTAQHLTATGMVFGSPLFMSPEQCRGDKLDARSDIYSLGCVLYCCLAGEPPFQGDNPLQTLYKHIHQNPESLKCDTETERQLEGIILKCLEKEPAARYQSASELVAALNMVGARLDLVAPASAAPASATPTPVPAPPPVPAPAHTPAPSPASSAPMATPPPIPTPTPSTPAALPSATGASPDARPQPRQMDEQERQELLLLQKRFKRDEPADSERSSLDVAHQERSSKVSDMRRSAPPPPGPRPGWHTTAAVALGVAVLIPCLALSGNVLQKEYNKITLSRSIAQGDASFQSANWTEAQLQYQEALKASNHDPESDGKIHSRLGRALFHLGRVEDALKNFSKAVTELHPSMDSDECRDYYLDAVYGMGQALSRQDHVHDAGIRFSEAIALASKFADDLTNGDILAAAAKNAAQDNFGQAMSLYDQALDAYRRADKKPSDKIALVLIDSAEAREKMGNIDDAAKRAAQAQIESTSIGSADVKSDVQRRVTELQQRNRISSAPAAVPFPGVSNLSNIPSVQSIPAFSLPQTQQLTIQSYPTPSYSSAAAARANAAANAAMVQAALRQSQQMAEQQTSRFDVMRTQLNQLNR